MNKQLLLKNCTLAEVMTYTKAHYDELYAELTQEQKSQVKHEVIAQDILDTLNGKSPQSISFNVPLEATEGQCIADILMVAFDCLGIVMSLIGIGSSESKAVGNAITAELRGDEAAINGLAKIIETFQAGDSSPKEKALAVWKIFSAVIRYTGVKAFIKAIKKEMHWYTWLMMAITIIGQVSLWFATDGVAAIAEIVLLLAAMETTGVDIAKAVTDCENIDHNVPTPPTIVGNSMLAGQKLQAGEALMSSNGMGCLVMQHDANLVLYRLPFGAAFSSQTANYDQDNCYASLQHDGNFCVYPPGGTPGHAYYCIYGNAGELSGDNCKIVLDSGGALRLYDANGKELWFK